MKAVGLALALAALLPLAAQQPTTAPTAALEEIEAPRVTYTKSFHGSVPSFIEISVRQDGVARFLGVQKVGEPPVSFAFTAAKPLVERIFGLARSLHDFSMPELASKQKVGYMGTKMLAYDDAARHAQQTYNFTSVPAARDLTDIFERIATSGEHAVRLQHAVRYDRLGVVQELDGITADWSQHQMLAPELLRPVLERVADDPALMDIAHRRAQNLLASLRDALRVR